MFRSLYLQIKKIPILGHLVVRLRDFWHFSWIKRQLLRRQDLREITKWTDELFPEQIGLTEELVQLYKSSLFRDNFSYGHAGDFDFLALYAVARATKPEIVIETGVASGRSSTAILLALQRNGLGKLYSIDLPQHYMGNNPETYQTNEGNTELKGFVPEGEMPGWLVPNDLRTRWELILGDSKIELPKLLNRLHKVDVFYHDSDHSYDSMMFEFTQVWSKMSSGGLLLSDDIGWNKSWLDFTSRVDVAIIKGYRNFGLVKK